jgi:SP family galactose:H+ symporter-like MFS transporter
MKTGFTLVVAFLAAVGGFLFGYDTGSISGALLYIKNDLNLGTFQQELVVSILPFGAIFGALLAGYITDRFGRKKVLLMASIFFTIAALLMAFSHSFNELLLGRLIAGLCIGITSMTAPLYISEMSPAKYRGLCVSANQLLVTVGILVAYFVDLYFGQTQQWRWMLGLSAVPALVLLISMIFLPETPRWLVGSNSIEKAQRTFMRLGYSEKETLESIEDIKVGVREVKGSYRECFKKNLRRPLLAGILLAVFQQFIGINTVIYYAPSILTHIGEGEFAALIATAGIGVTNVLMTVIALFLIDRVGRKPLLFWGTLAMVVALFVLGAGSFFQEEAVTLRWVYNISLLLYICGFALGLGPVAWLFISEVYPLKVRGRAMSIATVANWLCNFIVAITFLTFLEALGPGLTFCVYGGIGVLTLLFVIYGIPETKGKTLEEISQFWKREPKV